ncbi:MAG: DUF4167 domain-containing protein [Amaricoccus sp.]
MRPSNKSRSRNKPGNNGGHNNGQRRNNSMGNIINRVFESAGPDGKVRGTPQQIIDKYQALARDAQVAGDRVAAESYLQHSEHYSRMLGEAQRQLAESRGFNQEREDGQREDGQREDGFDGQRRQPPMNQPFGSGLAMIDPDDSFDMAGPIDTPEGRRTQARDPAPVVALAPPPQPERQPEPEPQPALVPEPAAGEAMNGTPQGEPAAEPAEATAPEAPRRGRPRRRPKQEAAPAPAEPAE